jgi:hypothetical protein
LRLGRVLELGVFLFLFAALPAVFFIRPPNFRSLCCNVSRELLMKMSS